MQELRVRAQRWADDDPDPADRAEILALVEQLPASTAELADRFAAPLTFGTAGLRGVMRAGPNGMNLAVVRQAARGLMTWLEQREATQPQDVTGPVVIGYDARRNSRAFAEQTARVVTGAGRQALLLPRPLPTPVLAHTVIARAAAVGVMVTASHNPPADNGYKVYLGPRLGGSIGAGAQIAPPVDAEIEAAIRAVTALSDVPLGDAGEVLGEDAVDAYVDGAVAILDPKRVGAADRARLVTAYTALHGVGAELLAEAFARAGFARPIAAAQQSRPDPDFPTVAYPNPEEPGAMDLVLRLAAEEGADLAIANDPDADRCAVAIAGPDRRDPASWRMLHGDEVGVLLGDHLIRRSVGGLYATTIVSSTLLGRLCQARGMGFAQTLTGFKWIVRAGGERAVDLVYGYEEALGYCVAPHHVRDKDGITAALLVAELAAELKAAGRSIADRLDELAAEFGRYGSDQISVRVRELTEIDAMMARLRGEPPRSLLGRSVTSIEDLAPAADVVTLRNDSTRVVVRPSGTEPKLKAYLEVVEPPESSRADVLTRLAALRAEVLAALGVPG